MNNDNPFDAPKAESHAEEEAEMRLGKRASAIALYGFIGSLSMGWAIKILFNPNEIAMLAVNMAMAMCFLVGLLAAISCFRYFRVTKYKPFLHTSVLFSLLNGFGFAANSYTVITFYLFEQFL